MEYLIDINNTDEDYMSNLKLHSPMPIQGGSYLAKLTLNGNPILFQMPKCSTKKGIVSSGKRFYCDLLFKYDDTNVIDTIETMENIIRDKVFEKSELWFQDPPTLEDIEYNWNESIKQTKQNFYLRTYVGNSKNVKSTISVYNSDQEQISMEDITPSSNIITIVEVTGLKFSSSSFHINYCLRQVMVLEDAPIFNKCLISVAQPKQLSHKQTINNNSIIKENSEDHLEKSNIELLEKQDNQSPFKNTYDEMGEKIEDIAEDTTDDTMDDTMDDTTEDTTDDLEILDNHTNLMDDTLDSSFDLNKDSNETSAENTINLENTEDTNDVEDEHVNLHTGSQERDTHQSTQQQPQQHPKQQIDSQEISKHINTLINKEPDTDTLEIKEVDIGMPEEEDAVLLKKPDTVYLDIYNKAVEKAKEARLKAIQAYLELKEIKNKYMIEEINDDEEDNFPNFDF
jgi:hypothetical protein